MRYSAAITAVAAVGAYAQLSKVQSVLTSVESGIDGLNTAASSFNGDTASVQSKSESLIASIKSGKTTVDGSSDLTLADALGLTDPVQSLTKKGQTLADTFKSKRSAVEKAGACDTVRSALASINTNGKALITSIVDKVPKDAQAIAANLASGLTKVLTQAQDDFSEANCKNAGGAASSAPSKPSSSAAAMPTGTSSAMPTGSSSAMPTGSSSDMPYGSDSSIASGTASNMPPGSTMVPTAGPYPSGSGSHTTNDLPSPTAGASFLAPAGALVLAVAAALL